MGVKMNGYAKFDELVSSNNTRTRGNNHIPRVIALTSCFYLAAALPITAYASVEATITTTAARAAAALGAGEGLAVSLAGASAAALAIGVFAIAFCGTSYVMGTDLCIKSEGLTTGGVTGGRIAIAINNPAYIPQYQYRGKDSVFYSSQYAACESWLVGGYKDTHTVANQAVPFSPYCLYSKKSNSQVTTLPGSNATRVAQSGYNANASPALPPATAGQNIAITPSTVASLGAAAAAKARGASDAAAVAAAEVSAEVTGTGNPARDRAAGNTAAAAGAAAAAAEASGGSPADVRAAAKDAANAAVAAADKAQPQDKTCQSSGASFDGTYCTDAAAAPYKGDLPFFCSWASSVCGFFDWTKSQFDDVAPVTATDTSVNIKNQHKNDADSPISGFNIDQQRVTFAAQCPAPVNFTFGFMGHSQNLSFRYDALCEFMSQVRPLVIASSYLAGAYIVVGAARREN